MNYQAKISNYANPHEFKHIYQGMSVLVTGHSGFTGSWLCQWLIDLGANVSGLSLPPITSPNLFEAWATEDLKSSTWSTINEYPAVKAAVDACKPQIIFHLAAQPLVKRAYEHPLESFETNVMGTAHVLEAARQSPSTQAVVCVTTDKVYADQNWSWGYRETDRIGGKDPYSASKSAAEMVTFAYQQTLADRTNGVAIATARGGNIIGGGDWSDNRIVPDFVRAHVQNTPLTLRQPNAIRPWQHVIALCHGYLSLGSYLLDLGITGAENFNFGPSGEDTKTVGELVETLTDNWPGAIITYGDSDFIETETLRVDSAKARQLLSWQPPINFKQTVAWTAQWYRDYYAAPQMAGELCRSQITEYCELVS